MAGEVDFLFNAGVVLAIVFLLYFVYKFIRTKQPVPGQEDRFDRNESHRDHAHQDHAPYDKGGFDDAEDLQMAVCPRCGVDVEVEADSCSECGASFWSPLIHHGPLAQKERNRLFPQMNTTTEVLAQCPACSAHVEVDARVCKACGQRFWSPLLQTVEHKL